ncbi:unnamed protein product [Alopecurus aequalis]
MGLGGAGGSMLYHGRRARSRRSGRRNRVLRSPAHWGDVSDHASSSDDVYDTNSSSSESDIRIRKRKRSLDDALFDFVSRQGIKRLRKSFYIFCKDSDLWKESKKSQVHVASKDSFSFYSAKYFFDVLSRLTFEQKAIIQKFGFGCLLSLSKTYLPSSFIRWLATCVDPICSEIDCGDKSICISKDSFHFVLGLPNSGSPLVENSPAGLQFLMSLFHLSDVPHITFFGNKLNLKECLSDQELFACFMQIFLSCFLCPSAGDSLDTKYIDQLGDPERARRFDICSLAYKHLMHGVMKTADYIRTKGRKSKRFEFCSYALGVYYLDCLDFGVHIAGSGLPRSVSWRGDMIKTYSDLDRKGRKGFGRRRIRKDLASCYYHGVSAVNKCCAKCGSLYEELSAREKEQLHNEFGTDLVDKCVSTFAASCCLNEWEEFGLEVNRNPLFPCLPQTCKCGT